MAKNRRTKKSQAYDAMKNEDAGSASVKTCVSLRVEIRHDDGVCVCFLKTKDPSQTMTFPK